MKKFLIFISVVLCITGCRDKNMIPDDDLMGIISDAYMADAYLREFADNYDRDTLTFMQPILDKYGYTIDQMEYTFRKMSTRKTSPLPRLIDKVVTDYAEKLKRYRRGYEISLRWDTLANKRATLELMLDSMYASKVEDLKKTHFELPMYRSGIYTITMSYRIDSADNNRGYLIRYTLKDTTDAKTRMVGSVWLGKMGRRAFSVTDVEVDARKYNLMDITFLSPNNSMKFVGDPKVSIDTMMVTYRPPIEKARELNYEHYFGIFNRHADNFKVYENKKDSSALRPGFRVPYAIDNNNRR